MRQQFDERKIYMHIQVIGLGLIGGSFCKAIKAKTAHTLLGFDQNSAVMQKALSEGAIDAAAQNLGEADLTIVCLHPRPAIEFMLKRAGEFKKGSVVIDACGVKKQVQDAVFGPLSQNGVTFIGAHPMAGREFSGYDFSLASLFEGASFILTPEESTPEDAVAIVTNLAKDLGFTSIVKTTPEKHDAVIAYTSQLCHVVSNAYVKSPTLGEEKGFSAGSFQDLTRVAKLDENMWASLFFMNKQPLVFELETHYFALKRISFGPKAKRRGRLNGPFAQRARIKRKKHGNLKFPCFFLNIPTAPPANRRFQSIRWFPPPYICP